VRRPEEEQPEEERRREEGAGGIRVPVIGIRIPAPPLPLPTRAPGRVLWLGGLLGAAVLGAIEWPIAALLAAATWVVERLARTAVREELEHRPEPEHG
jgi:hypothetical protein